MSRNVMLAKIHVAKKQTGMVDDDYRALLGRVAGKASAKDCSEKEMLSVLAEFRRLGFADAKRETVKRAERPFVRMIYGIWSELEKDGHAHGGRAALHKFVERQTGVAQPEWLTPAQGNLVIEGLKGWRARVRKVTA